MLNYFKKHNRGFVLSLLAVIALVYIPFIGSQLIFDDWPFFLGGTINHFVSSPFNFDPRWFSYASLAWTWEFFSDIPPIHRLFNILLHGACVLLLLLWLRQITTLSVSSIDARNKAIVYISWGIWLGALFFASNPVAVYAVGYLVQRSILLATLFTLAMQLAYLHGLICQQKLGQKLWLSLSVGFFFLAVFSKEHSLMAPAIILATTFLLRPYIVVDKRMLWATWLGYFIIALFIVLRIKGVLGSVYEFDAPELFEQLEMTGVSTITLHILSVLTQAGLFFKYLFLWALPNPAWMSIDMREPFVQSLYPWRNWMPAIGFILYGLLAFRLLLYRGRLGLAGLALLYPWLFFMVEFSIIRVQETFVLYRSYLWLPGTMLFFPLLLNILPNRKITTLALTVLILAMVPLSWNRLRVLADNYRLWNDAALLLPNERTTGAARIYYNRGLAELKSKHWSNAIADYQRVKAINPKIEQIYNNMGTAYSSLGNYQEAINNFDRAIVLNPDYANAYYGKGLTLLRMHLGKEAMISMKKSCELGNSTGCLLIAFSNSGKKH
jgi:protein O-mannosyl-transferase